MLYSRETLLAESLMAKTSKQTQKNSSNIGGDDKSSSKNGPVTTKGKRTRKTVPRESPQQRSSVFRGVTRYIYGIVNYGVFVSLNLLDLIY